MKRFKALNTFNQLKPSLGAKKAARLLGTSPVSLWRWQKAFAAGGIEALRPRFTNAGRRSKAAGVPFSMHAICELERLLAESGCDEAWRRFTASGHCPAAVVRLGLRTMPAPVERLVNLRPVQARCKVSADGRRLYLQIRKGATHDH